MIAKSAFPVDENLFKDMVRHYTQSLNLPPLAAKIYSYLTFDGTRKGLEFDEVVEIFGASKSSVSTSLNLLMKQNLIIDETKIDARRRIFLVNDNAAKIKLQQISNKLKSELRILETLDSYLAKAGIHPNSKAVAYRETLQQNLLTIDENLPKL